MLGFRRKKVFDPTWDKTGVSAFSDSEGAITIDWQDVAAIYAYKKDCLTVDQIRLIIASKEWQIEFTDDDLTFNELRDHISRVFAIGPDWHLALVRSPAFELTWTVVYSTESTTDSKETK